jgi:hypothetical protein
MFLIWFIQPGPRDPFEPRLIQTNLPPLADMMAKYLLKWTSKLSVGMGFLADGREEVKRRAPLAVRLAVAAEDCCTDEACCVMAKYCDVWKRGVEIVGAKSQSGCCCKGNAATAAEMEVDIAAIAPSQAYRCIHMHLRMSETTAGEPLDILNRERM